MCVCVCVCVSAWRDRWRRQSIWHRLRGLAGGLFASSKAFAWLIGGHRDPPATVIILAHVAGDVIRVIATVFYSHNMYNYSFHINYGYRLTMFLMCKARPSWSEWCTVVSIKAALLTSHRNASCIIAPSQVKQQQGQMVIAKQMQHLHVFIDVGIRVCASQLRAVNMDIYAWHFDLAWQHAVPQISSTYNAIHTMCQVMEYQVKSMAVHHPFTTSTPIMFAASSRGNESVFCGPNIRISQSFQPALILVILHLPELTIMWRHDFWGRRSVHVYGQMRYCFWIVSVRVHDSLGYHTACLTGEPDVFRH